MIYLRIKPVILVLIICLGFSASFGCNNDDGTEQPIDPSDTITQSDVSYWLTKPDQSVLLAKQSTILNFKTTANQFQTITVDTSFTFQTMDGFGFSLTGGSAYNINKLAVAERQKLLRELFSTDKDAISINYLRISIGASDLDATVFSYDDLPAGQTDETLQHFSIEPDKAILIPLLKEIIAINPTIKIMGTPWSAPKWMKTNNNSIGGSLKPQYYSVYAQYLVKYIQAMRSEGIAIDAITVQNEPLHDGNNPSMYMTSNDMKTFVKSHLGPAFQTAGISTKIVVYDHNCDYPEYATNILSDADAAQYVDGSAFHLYAGDISALSLVHDAYPAKNLYFTEQWVGGPSNFGGDMQWHLVNLIIGASRNWAKCVLEWNLASDQNYQPHTNGGCTQCEGALTINNGVTRNVSYYIIGHASKFLPVNSVRINSNYITELPNVAFRTPSGKKVLIVINTSNELKTFNISFKGKLAPTSLPSGAVATYQWD